MKNWKLDDYQHVRECSPSHSTLFGL